MFEPSETPSPINVLIIDDQRAVLAGVRALVDAEAPAMQVAGLANNGSEALEMARRTRPCVIVLDIDLGASNGLDLIPLLNRCCSAKIVVFTCIAEPTTRRRALNLGAAAFVSKTAHGGELIAAIRLATEQNHPVE